MNKVILLGRLGRDPELKYTTNGKAYCKFTLATSDKFGDKDKTEWHSVVSWNKPAETMSQYLKKGSQVLIEGKVTYRSWENDKGERKYATEILTEKFRLLGGQSSSNSYQAAPQFPKNDMPTQPQVSEDPLDQIPF